MEVYIDNKKVDFEKKEYKSFGVVMDEVNKVLEKEGKLLYDIYVNGEVLSANQVISGSDISLLEITTRSPKLVIIRALQDMDSFIERFFESLDVIAADSEVEDEANITASIYELVGGLEWSHNVLLSMKENTAIDFMLEDFDSFLEEFGVCLNMIQDAMESRDMVTVFEMLENDMVDILEDLSGDLGIYQEVIMQEEVRENKYA